MDSPQSVASPFKGSSVFTGSEKRMDQRVDFFASPVQSKDSEGIIGALEVYIHQARDIHNICIYQKQDVYAKIYLTRDPEKTVSTQIINGGGQNPVFNEKLRINVSTIDSSLKCEIWMLSRVRNYLEDQFLGYALVPLSEVLISNGKLEKELSLSSTDLFHSPAGFVQLSLSYSGFSPEVIELPSPPAAENVVQGSYNSEVTGSHPCELDKIEFPDPNVANENQQMVSEYYGLPNANLDSRGSECFVSSDTENQLSSETGNCVVESFSTSPMESTQLPKHDSPPCSLSTTNGLPLPSLPADSVSSDAPGASKSPNQQLVSPPKENLREKREEGGDAESNNSGRAPAETFAKPVFAVNVEPEQKVVQQDIVDMYMKSMQEFTESLAKMKLPMDIESGLSSSENSSLDQKSSPASKDNGSRVFYGSRAFF